MADPARIEEVEPAAVAAFFDAGEREALAAAWGFPVVWHERRYAFRADAGDGVARGALQIAVAASLVTIERLAVAPEARRRGLGRELLAAAESLGKYYNCHKVTAAVPLLGDALAFFAACGYRVEATLAQHAFKRDVALVRKFLL